MKTLVGSFLFLFPATASAHGGHGMGSGFHFHGYELAALMLGSLAVGASCLVAESLATAKSKKEGK